MFLHSLSPHQVSDAVPRAKDKQIWTQLHFRGAQNLARGVATVSWALCTCFAHASHATISCLTFRQGCHNSTMVWELFLCIESYIFSATCSSHLMCLGRISLFFLCTRLVFIMARRAFLNTDGPSCLESLPSLWVSSCFYFLWLQIVPRWIPE